MLIPLRAPLRTPSVPATHIRISEPDPAALAEALAAPARSVRILAALGVGPTTGRRLSLVDIDRLVDLAEAREMGE